MENQVEDLLVGNALIFLLSGGYFPKNFMVNSGDWMVKFTEDDRLNLFLITVRGGFEEIRSEKEWQERMMGQIERVPGMERTETTMPLFYQRNELVSTAIDKAKKLLK